VNAAIVMRPWRKGIGHAGRNKAIVVDLMVDVADLRGGPRDEIVEGSRPIAGGGGGCKGLDKHRKPSG